jgi:hypothetical protein
VQLPKATTARQLAHIIQHTNAQTCYIPKVNDSEHKRLAIFTFKTKQDLDAAVSQNAKVDEHNLKWISRNTRICRHCSSPDHISETCREAPTPTPSTPRQRYTINKPSHYSPHIFQQNNLSNYSSNRRSYADTVRNNNSTPNHLTSDLIKDIRDALTELIAEMKEVKNRVTEVEGRVSLLEKKTYERYTHESEETSSMDEDAISATSQETIPLENKDLTNIRHQQEGINTQLQKMEALMNNTLSAIASISPHNSQSNSR